MPVFLRAARRLAVAIVLALFVLPSIPRAATRPLEVGGFAFDMEVTVPGAPLLAFDAFTQETIHWWDHHFSEKPQRLFFETWPGGGFIEVFDEDPAHGARHATVIYVDRGKEIRFTGPLGLSGHALVIVHTLKFEATETGTLLKLSVHATGEMDDGWPAAVEGVWNHFLVERFKPYMEKKLGAVAPRPR